MIGALTYEEVLQATMRSNWIHALWLFAVVVLIWVCTNLLTLYGNRKKKPKDKMTAGRCRFFLLVLVVIGYGICVGTSVPEENARIQQDIDEHAYVTVHGSYTRNTASRRSHTSFTMTIYTDDDPETPLCLEPPVLDDPDAFFPARHPRRYDRLRQKQPPDPEVHAGQSSGPRRFTFENSPRTNWSGGCALCKCHAAHGERPSGMGFPARFSIFAIGICKRNTSRLAGVSFEAPPGFEPGVKDLQSHALPLGYGAKNGAGNEIRTRYLHLGKVALCQMSYARKMVPPVGIEPTTRGFSVPCSTN